MGCVTNRANSAEPAKPGSSTDPNASKTPAITINNKALTDTNNKAFTAAKDTYAGSAAQVNNFGNELNQQATNLKEQGNNEFSAGAARVNQAQSAAANQYAAGKEGLKNTLDSKNTELTNKAHEEVGALKKKGDAEMQGALDSFNGGKAKGMETIKEYSAPYQAAGDELANKYKASEGKSSGYPSQNPTNQFQPSTYPELGNSNSAYPQSHPTQPNKILLSDEKVPNEGEGSFHIGQKNMKFQVEVQ